MQLTPLQALDALDAAGFSYNNGIIRMLAIGYAESSLVTDAVYVNSDQWKSRDRGWLMINDHWHSEVSDACAFDYRCAAIEAWRISSHGISLSQWATYKDGGTDKPYYRYMPISRLAFEYWTYRSNATQKISDLNQQVLQLQATNATEAADLAKAQFDLTVMTKNLADEVALVNKYQDAMHRAVSDLQAAQL